MPPTATADSAAMLNGTDTALPIVPGTMPQSPFVPATPEPSAEPTLAPTMPAVSATITPTALLPGRPTVQIVPHFPTLTNEERWRAQEENRTVFPQPRVYVAQRPTQLWWYDPLAGQSLPVGTLLGPFTAQAAFTFRPLNAPALEVPYRIDGDYGLTAIAPSVKQRMAAAGYAEFAETYVLLSDDVVQQH
ncbi:MAG TPA: hypothetical protein VFT66_04035 [Roseiflexaceae bacterium]|nr:hypothetical protein [Roseiflexaceae bacterium]